MQDRYVINASYYCKRGIGEGLILVLNTGAYLLAEYSELTGELKWQRVIPAEHRKSIEGWLGKNFPVKNLKSRSVAHA